MASKVSLGQSVMAAKPSSLPHSSPQHDWLQTCSFTGEPAKAQQQRKEGLGREVPFRVGRQELQE